MLRDSSVHQTILVVHSIFSQSTISRLPPQLPQLIRGFSSGRSRPLNASRDRIAAVFHLSSVVIQVKAQIHRHDGEEREVRRCFLAELALVVVRALEYAHARGLRWP